MFGRFADFRSKMAIFRRAGMRKGGLPLPLAFLDSYDTYEELVI